MSHPVDSLFNALSMVEPYPSNVVPLWSRISGTGFSPGGAGLWVASGEALPPLPTGGLMVLGHNLDCVSGFGESVARGQEDLNGATWRGLRNFLPRILPSGGEPLERCFFTNFFIGLILGERSVGRFPGAADHEFVTRCLRFFVHQVEIVRPSVVAVLGIETPRLLASLCSKLAPWDAATSFQGLDAAGAAFIPEVRIGQSDLFSAVVLTHPSMRSSNVHRRRFRGLEGDRAELEMMRCAFEAGAG